MKALKVYDILKAAKGTLLCGSDDGEITSVCTDSRRTGIGALFVPLVGNTFDGHDFLEEALSRGSVAALTQRDEIPFLHKDEEMAKETGNTPETAAIIKVDDTLKALGKVAGLYRGMFNIPALAITGSVGKTTTKEMTAGVLLKKYNLLKNEGNFNNELGVPLTLLKLTDSHEFLVSEMGMDGFGEIDRLSEMIKPEIVMMTNIGVSHIELLGSKENIYKAKSEFLKNIKTGGTVIINGDDPILMSHIGELGESVVTVGIKNKESTIIADNIKINPDGVSFTVSGYGAKFPVTLYIPGEHNVYNALFACAAGMIYNIDTTEISAALGEFVPTDMRLATIKLPDYTIINDCYNAAPDSMKAALKVLGAKQGRKVAVLGDIKCLGEYSFEAHKEIGAEVYLCGTDILITIGENARIIAEGAFEAGLDSARIFSFDDVDSALKKIGSIINVKDTILIKASRAMQLERVTEYLTKQV